MHSTKKIIDYFLILSLLIYGLYLCFINNYGWDWDTYAMLETFLNLKENGNYIRSRGAGYLIPEIGFGFLAYNFGSFISNLITFIFLLIGLWFFYKAGEIILNLKRRIQIIFFIYHFMFVKSYYY